jgi:multidrug transporter EmrE-like cation transporter
MIYIVASALLNVMASVLLKLAINSMTRGSGSWLDLQTLALIVAAMGAYGGAFIAYFLALTQVPISIAYVTITGSAAVLIVIVGVFLFHDRIGGFHMACMALIVAGLAGLHGKL